MEDQLDIYEATLACRQVFRDSGAVPILQEWAENCLADLNLWADGAGASKVGKASLDARLSLSQDAKTFVVNLLGMLQAFVERCIEEGRDVHGDGLDQAMQDVKSIIGQLTIITTSIRKAGTNSRIQKADASYDPGHPQIQALCHHLQLLLLARPSEIGILLARASSHGMILVSPIDDAIVADSHSLTVIQRRLIKANLKRRNRFLYAQRHAVNLSEREPVPSTSTLTLQKSPQPTVLNDFRRATEVPELPKSHSTTTATEVQDPISLPTRTSAQPTTTVISAISSRVTYPKPPAILRNQNVFQCPCCCQTLSTSMSKGSQWKKHLSRDILPYVCILENCPHPERLYHTKDIWLSHMFTDHGGVSHWVCLACNDSSERPVFYEESALAEHLEQKHSKGINPEQISMLVSAWLRKMPVTIRSCPLCEFKNQESDAVLNHVAEHLHSFSLRSLPWAAEDGETNGNLYDGYYQDHPYFDTESSVDKGSAGSMSTKSSEPRDLQDLSVIDSDEGLTEDNQLTEEKIQGLVEDPIVYKDMLDVFLAGIENQEPLQKLSDSRPPSPAPSDSESATDGKNYDLFLISVPEDLKDHPSWENCRLVRPISTDNDEMPFAYIDTEHKAVRLLNTSRQVCASFDVAQSNKANAVGRAIQQAELLSRATHLRELKADIPHLLSHRLKCTLHNVTHGRDLALDGTADIMAGDRIILELKNEGEENIFVSVFSSNVAGMTSLVSTASPRGIELSPDGPRKCYVLGRMHSYSGHRGLKITWPKNLPATAQQSVPDYLIFIVSSAAVDLRCLESHSRYGELLGDPSQLEKLAYEVSYGQGRDCGAKGLPDIRWDLITISFNLHYSH